MPKNRYRQIKRLREIAGVFIKYGFFNQLQQVGLLKHMKVYPLRKNPREENETLTRGQRVRLALEELGPAFVKLGQLLSTRHEIIPRDVIEELENLQNQVGPISYEEIKKQVERELEASLEELFLEFQKTPLAAASIAQVHRASLKNGKNVVVKVQRPGIRKKIAADVAIIEEVAVFLDNKTKYGKLYNFTALAKDFKKTLLKELDFYMEAKNSHIFQENFKEYDDILFPSVYQEYSSKRVLTMEFIPGISLGQVELLKKKKLDPPLLSRKLTHCILEQILRDGFFHGDPHPGNIRVLPNNRIAFLDMGIVGKIGEEKRIELFKMIAGITWKNNKLIVESIRQLGAMNGQVNFRQLEEEIDALRDEYLEVPLREIQIGEFLNEVFQLAFGYNIRIPNEIAMIGKTLIILEDIVSRLDPSLNILEIAQPITEQLVKEVYSPKRLARKMGENLLDAGKLITQMPSSLLNILRQVENHELNMILSFKNEDQIIKTLNKIANQLSFSIALLALGIVISGFIIGLSFQGDGFGILGNSFVTLGLIMSLIMGVWLIISIIKSGRF